MSASLSQWPRECRDEGGFSTGVHFTPDKATGHRLQVSAPAAGAASD